MPRLLVWSMKDVRDVIEKCINNKFDFIMFIEGKRGLGKTQVKGSKVLMKDGSWKNVEDIKIDDKVISPQQDGTFTYAKVIETHNRFENEIYDVYENNREKKLLYSCAYNHIIPVWQSYSPLNHLSARNLSTRYTKDSNCYSYTITKIDFSNKDCSLNPIAINVIRGKSNFVYGFELDKSQTKSQWYITDNWMVTHNSSFAYKLLCSLKTPMPFRPKRDIVYTREETLKHLATKKGGIIFSDEMVNVAFNRDFYQEEQKTMLKALNMYRDSCNVFVGCIPRFVELDKNIQELCKMRVTIVRRGVALIQTQMPSIYSTDSWDIRNNQKIESRWAMRSGKNPQYSKLSTVRGILSFSDLSPHQRAEYEAIKEEKRNRVFGEYQDLTLLGNPEKMFYDNLLKQIKEDKLNQETFETFITINNMDVAKARRKINDMLKELGDEKRFKDYVMSTEKKEKRDKYGFLLQQAEKKAQDKIVPARVSNIIPIPEITNVDNKIENSIEERKEVPTSEEEDIFGFDNGNN